MSDTWLNLSIGNWHIQIKYRSLCPRLLWNPHVFRRWWEIHLHELEWPWPKTPEEV